MKFAKSRVFQIVIILLIMAVIFVVSGTATQEVQDSITIATAILGFLLILVQLNRDHKIKKAEFIYNLNQTFSADADIHTIYMKLKAQRDNKDLQWTDEDGRLMGNYVMFFIIMEYMLSENLVTLSMIDAIFANKFFLFCDNKAVYDYQTSRYTINAPLLRLYERWYNFRNRKGLPLICTTWQLSKCTDLFDTDPKGMIHFKH